MMNATLDHVIDEQWQEIAALREARDEARLIASDLRRRLRPGLPSMRRENWPRSYFFPWEKDE